MRTGPGTSPDATTGEQRRQDEFGNVLGQRRHRGQDQRRWSADKDRDRKRLAPRRGARVVKAAALADLPVHSRRPRVVDLHPIDPEVVAGAVGILGVDEGQSQERAAVLGPRGDDRQATEIDVTGLDLAHRPGSCSTSYRDADPAATRSLADHNEPRSGGNDRWTNSTARRTSCAGRRPNAISARRGGAEEIGREPEVAVPRPG